jgi:hypothetical protein
MPRISNSIVSYGELKVMKHFNIKNEPIFQDYLKGKSVPLCYSCSAFISGEFYEIYKERWKQTQMICKSCLSQYKGLLWRGSIY